MRLKPDFSPDGMGVCAFGGDSSPSGQTTTTTNSAPWSGQQPSLLRGLQTANLYADQGVGGALAPNYYPGQTQAQQNSYQTQAGNQAYDQGITGGITALHAANNGISTYADGSQVNSNPGNATAGQFASGAMLGTNPAQQGFQNITGQAGASSGAYANQAAGMAPSAQNNPALGLMGQTFGQAGQNGNAIAGQAQGYASSSLYNPGSDMQYGTASGQMLSAQNPYFQQMAATTLANTMPSIQGAFAGAGRSDSGLAARAASEGANDAIGGLAYQNYNQGLQNQLTAQQNVAQNYTAGQQAQTANLGLAQTALNNASSQQNTAAANLGSTYATGQQQSLADLNSAATIQNQGLQTQLGAQKELSSLVAGQQGQQLQGAQQVSDNYNQGVNNALKGATIAPTLDAQSMAELNNAQGYGNQLYNQQQANDVAAKAQYDYGTNQQLQYLQNYNGLIQGNYGSQKTDSTPYYMNSTANTLAGINGTVGIANGLFGSNGLMNSLFPSG